MTLLDCPPMPLVPPRRPARRVLRRALMGGALSDRSRLPRYAWIGVLGLAMIWAPITGYLKTAAPVFSSHMSLILPGSGSASSVNLAEIGQASSHANSAFSSNAVSPTETYKRLLAADRVVADAARRLGLDPAAFGAPQIRLVDQTAFIHVKVTGPGPEEAQARNRSLRDAFFAEIDRLRGDEMKSRQTGALDAIREYRDSVAATRSEIARLRAETGLYSVAQYDRQIDEADALRVRIEEATAELRRKTATVAGLELRLDLDAETAARVLRLNGDTAYVALVDAMALASADLAQARARYGERHPEVLKARADRDSARAKAEARALTLTGRATALERSSDGGRAALLADLVQQESDRAGLEAQLAELRAHLAEQTERLDRLAPRAARLEDLQRDFDVAEAVFASAIARSQSSKADIYASYPLVQVLEDPTFPDDPSAPRRKLALAAGGAATMLLLIALTLGWVRRRLIEKLIAEKGLKA